jgi:hypothetical protein
VFCARAMRMSADAAMEYVMLPLNNKRTAAEERCFLRDPCRDVISKTVSEELVSELVELSD